MVILSSFEFCIHSTKKVEISVKSNGFVDRDRDSLRSQGENSQLKVSGRPPSRSSAGIASKGALAKFCSSLIIAKYEALIGCECS